MRSHSVLVVSHRRSGTHLLIDLLRHNFGWHLPYISYKDMDYKGDDKKYINKFIFRVDTSPRIFKAHCHTNFESYYKKPIIASHFKKTLNNCSVIYVIRDIKDTMTSLFFHCHKFKETSTISVHDFIYEISTESISKNLQSINRAQYWKYHVSGWMDLVRLYGFMVVKYEDILLRYDKVVDEISDYFCITKPSKIIDVRRSSVSLNDNVDVRYYSSVNFRNGIIGDCFNYLSSKDIAYLDGFQENIL